MTYFDRTFQDGSLVSPITLPKEVQQYIYSFIYDEVMVHSWMHKYKINKAQKRILYIFKLNSIIFDS